MAVHFRLNFTNRNGGSTVIKNSLLITITFDAYAFFFLSYDGTHFIGCLYDNNRALEIQYTDHYHQRIGNSHVSIGPWKKVGNYDGFKWL